MGVPIFGTPIFFKMNHPDSYIIYWDYNLLEVIIQRNPARNFGLILLE
jgi:hypothetical protein